VGRSAPGPLHFGTSAYFAAEHDDRVLELGHRLLLHCGYRGFAHVEFAYDARDDTYKLLEVNTRVPVCSESPPRRPSTSTSIALRRPLRPPGSAGGGLHRRPLLGLPCQRCGRLPADGSPWGAKRGEVFSGYTRRKIRATWASDDIVPAVASLRLPALAGHLRDETA